MFLERRKVRIFRSARSGFAEESKHMLAVFLRVAQAFENLLMRGRDLVLEALFLCQSGVPCGLSQDAMELLLGFSPVVFVDELAGARLEQILRWKRVVVALIPIVYQLAVGGSCDLTANPTELLRLDPCRQWPPTVTISEQNDEVRLDAGLLAAFNLAQADLHGLLVESRLIADTPAQVNGLEASVVFFTQLAQLREDVTLKGVALGLQVFKGGTDKNPESACGGWHRVYSRSV